MNVDSAISICSFNPDKIKWENGAVQFFLDGWVIHHLILI